jgi:hypothetical protein
MRRARTGTNLEAMEPTPSLTRREHEQLTTRADPRLPADPDPMIPA